MTTPDPSADEARLLLDRAERLGATATTRISWPFITTLLTLGAATSMGVLGMSVTSGGGYAAVLVAMLLWVFASIGVMVAFGRATRIGFQKRWNVYILAWAVAYVLAIMLVSLGAGLVGGIVGAALIAVVTVAGVVTEARS